MNEHSKFIEERKVNVDKMSKEEDLKQSGIDFLKNAESYKYSYNFDWLSRPIIQFPQDIVAYQELVWKVKPDLIIETGIAHGGSLILSASLLALLDLCENGQTTLAPDSRSPRKVIAVDIEIREHNRKALEEHPLSPRITLIQGSSIDSEIINEVKRNIGNSKKILVCLDSNHTHEHVLAELEAYAPLVSKGSYCCVFDTVIEDMPDEMFKTRNWGKGDNPKTAVWKYLENLKKEGRKAADGDNLNFEIDSYLQNKLLISVAPDGYLKRI